MSRNKRTKFESEVVSAVAAKGYATHDDLYRIYFGNYGKKNWGSELLTTLSQWAVSQGRIQKVEITIPDGPIALFPGRHATNTGVFFVSAAMDQAAAIETCSAALTRLCDAANKLRESKKTSKSRDKPKSRRQKQNQELPPITRTTSKSVLFESPGYLSSKVLRSSLLHHFLFVTFTSDFTPSDVVDYMPIELYMKVIGTLSVPRVLELEPKLRFLLMKCLPNALSIEMGVEEGKLIIQNWLTKMAHGRGLFHTGIVQQVSNNTYKVIRSKKILDLFCGSEMCLNMNSVTDLAWLWRYLEMVDLLENFDGFSKCLWQKRWEIDKITQKTKNRSSDFFDSMLKFVLPSRNLYFWEDLVETMGYEKPILQSALIPTEAQNGAGISLRQAIQEVLELSSEQEQNIDECGSDLDIIKYVAGYVSSKKGIIHARPIKWLKSNENRRLMKQTFANMMKCSPSMVSLFDEMTAENVVRSLAHGDTELQQSQVLHLFHYHVRGMVVPAEVGEVIEMSKRVLLARPTNSSASAIQNAIRAVKWNGKYVDALLFLVFSGFLTEQDRRHFVKKGRKQIVFDERYYSDYETAKKSIFGVWSSITRKPVVDFSPGGFAFLMNTDTVSIDLLGRSGIALRLHRIPEPTLPRCRINEIIENLPDSEDLSEQEVLFSHSTDMSLIAIQLGANIDTRFASFVYGCILRNGRNGLSLDFLIQRVCSHSLSIDNLVETIEFLMNVGFVREKHSCSVMPVFVADIFTSGNSNNHFWSGVMDDVDEQRLTHIQCEVYEIICQNPGIEIVSLAKLVPDLCLSDLMLIVATWELDESIYSSYTINRQADIFHDQTTVVTRVPSPLRIGYEIHREITDPRFERPQLRLYPTDRGGLSHPGLAFL